MISGSEKRQIQSLRDKGLGYKQIATKLGLTRDEVRNYCTSTTNDAVRKVHKSVEHMMVFGAEQHTEYISEEQFKEEYANLISRGYKQFRNPREVSWYATRENNTPYEETWIIEGDYLIPIASRVLER